MTHSAAGAERVPEATLQFLPDFEQVLEGDLKVGGRMTVEYAADRVPCRRERLGVQIGHLTPFIRFQPGAQVYRGTGARFSLPIPTDATEAEVWFYSWNPMGCSAWDSRSGQNYRFPVAGPTKAIDHVVQRSGSIPALDGINAFDESAPKVLHYFDVSPENGRELQTRLSVNAWVRNIVFDKNIWVDLHVLDVHDDRVHAGTLELHYLGPAGNGGDFFIFDDLVYQGRVAGPVPRGITRTRGVSNTAFITKPRIASIPTTFCTRLSCRRTMWCGTRRRERRVAPLTSDRQTTMFDD